MNPRNSSPSEVHEYTGYVRESTGWYKPVRKHIWAHNADEAAEVLAEEVSGRYDKIAIESNACKVFKTYTIKPVKNYELVCE